MDYSIIHKTSKLERIIQSIDLVRFEISDEDIEKLCGFDKNSPVTWSSGDLLLAL
jgi:diketogulonate reductase-like aldo/keto reductase